MEFEEKTLKPTTIYSGKILSLSRDEVSLPDGKTAIREIVHHGGGSCVLCEKNDKILFVKQYRYAYKKELLEIPAGKKNEGETPEQTALRELKEETGIVGKKAQHLFDVYPSPGYTDEVIKIYKVSEFYESESCLDDDEFLRAVWIEKSQVIQMMKNGEIKDGKTLIALLYALKLSD